MANGRVVYGSREYFDHLFGQLNPEFVAAFQQSGSVYDLMREFVYAMDHLDEISKMNSFKNEKLLNNQDIDSVGGREVNNMFASFAKSSRDPSWRIVPVGKDITESIQNFYYEGYIDIIYLVMLRLKMAELEFKLDGNLCRVFIQVETPHHQISFLDYVDVKRRVVVRIPFMKSRIYPALMKNDMVHVPRLA